MNELRDWLASLHDRLTHTLPKQVSWVLAPLSQLIALIDSQKGQTTGDIVLSGITADEIRRALTTSTSEHPSDSVRMPTRNEQATPVIEHLAPSTSDMAYSRLATTVRQNLEQIEKNISHARRDSAKWFALTIASSGFGVVVILSGIVMMLFGFTTAGSITTAASLLPNAFALLLFRKDGELRRTLEGYHIHILASQNLLSMVDLAETLTERSAKDAVKIEIIKTSIKIKEAGHGQRRATRSVQKL
jgi:hypothetical protein